MNRERLVKTFMELVKIPSESGNEKEFLNYLKKLLEKEGGRSQFDSYGNMITKFPAKNSTKKESLILSCHADTVKPGIGIEPYEDNGMARARGGNTILGADDKAGIAIVIEALRSAKKYPPIEFVTTIKEEIGLLGSRNLDFSLLDSKIGIVLDTESINDVILGGPTVVSFNVKYKGKSAHAGMEPEKGISAIQAASIAISKMKLGRIDSETTANVGLITGGSARNAVPENVEIIAECRSKSHEKCMKLAEEIKKHFEYGAEHVKATVNVEVIVEYKAYHIEEDNPAVKLAKEALQMKGLSANLRIITAGTDAAPFNNNNISTVCMGAGYYHAHSSEEYWNISEGEKICDVITTIMGILG